MINRTGTIYVLLIASIIMTVVSAGITYQNTIEKRQATHAVIHTYKTIQSATQLLSLLKDAETSERGYIITGDSTFLEPFLQAEADLEAELDSLSGLIQNTSQTSSLERKILGVVQRRQNELTAVLTVYKNDGKESAVKRVPQKVSKARMDTLRRLVRTLTQRERLLLANRDITLEQNTAMEDTVRFSAFTMIGITSLLALIALRRKQKRNHSLLETLNNLNTDLEQKVEERTHQLVEVNRQKDHFLGMASHDLKVPLSGILNLTNLLKNDKPTDITRTQQYLAYIEDSCRSMLLLISNLLDFNRMERSAITISIQTINLFLLYNRIKTQFEHPAQNKNIALQIDAPDQTIQSDHDIVTRILENLVSNAIKFSPAGTTVRIQAIVQAQTFSMIVADQGPGIPENEQPLLFRKFQKLSNKPTGVEGSTGLGLSIVKELVNLLQGTVQVHSKPSHGTTFTITLPIHPA